MAALSTDPQHVGQLVHVSMGFVHINLFVREDPSAGLIDPKQADII